MPVQNVWRAAVVPLVLVPVLSAAVQAENWPQWRGPMNNGISNEKNVPVRWSKTENVAWRLELPGPAGATPVVWGDRIFLTSATDGSDLLLICAGTDGRELWRRVVGQGNQNVRGDEGNYASPSPVTDGKSVWTFMGNGDLACYDFDGNLVWKANLQERYGKFDIQFGMSSTPVLHDGRLYMQLIHGAWNPQPSQEATVLALDGATGTEVWKQHRQSDAHSENKHSYASPVLYDDGKLQLLITHGADYAIAYRLSDGSEVWRVGGLNPKDKYDATLRFVASPAFASGIVVVPTAKRGPVVAVRPDAQGNLTGSGNVLWTYNRTPDVPSPVVHEGLVYLCMENGMLHVLDAKTGEPQYETRTHSVRHRSSPVLADGKLYLTARDGRVTVVKAGREFEVLAENEIGEDVTASPVISNGTLYLRSFDALWAVRAGE